MGAGDFSYSWDEQAMTNEGGGVNNLPGSQSSGNDSMQFSNQSADPEQNPDASGPGAGAGGYPPQSNGLPGGPNPDEGEHHGPFDSGNSNDRESVIKGNLDYLKDYYTKNFGRDIQNGETNDAQRAWELGIPIEQYISRANIDDRLTNKPANGALSALTATAQQLRSASNPQQYAQVRDQLSRQLTQTLQGQGHKVEFADDGTMMVDGRPYQIVGGDMAGMNSWMPTGQSGYTPGEIGFDDIPNFSFDSLMKMMETPEVDAAMRDLLAHPESMDAHTVDTMKAASKDELAGQQQMQEEDMHTLAGSYGFDESPWLASQTLASRQGRDNAVVQSNRAIDMQAATTNKADQRAAASLGQSWQAGKQTAVMGAVSASLDRAAAIGGRIALRESVNQAAEQLHQSAQSILANHIQFQLDNAMKKYGIDIGADISFAQLAQADQHHLEDLALNMQRLNEEIAGRMQQDRQFSADYELNKRKQKLEEDKWDWAQAHPGETNV